MRVTLGYLVGATLSLTGGVADLAYINVRLVPRMLDQAKPIPTPIAKRRESIAPAASPVPVRPELPQEIVYELATVVRFKTDSAELDERALAEIDRAANVMLRDPSLLARTFGHADERGPSPYNQELSERRAASVAAELLRLGVGEARIEQRGFGERMAKRRWLLDRRVEISIGGPRK